MRFLGLLCAIGLLAACTSPKIVAPTPPVKPEPLTAVYKQSDWNALPNWPGEQLTTTWPSWLNSCKRLISRPVWKDICADAVMLAPQDDASIQAFFERYFNPWQIETNTGVNTGLVTGYYDNERIREELFFDFKKFVICPVFGI